MMDRPSRKAIEMSRKIVAGIARIEAVTDVNGRLTEETLDAVRTEIAGVPRHVLQVLDEMPGLWGYTVDRDGFEDYSAEGLEWHWMLRQYRNRMGW